MKNCDSYFLISATVCADYTTFWSPIRSAAISPNLSELDCIAL